MSKAARIRHAFCAAALPLGILAAVLLLQLASAAGFLPSQASIMQTLINWVSIHGAPAVLVVSLLENTAVLNTYFPGAIAILSAMALTHGQPAAALQVWAAITLGAITGQAISYTLGRRLYQSEPDKLHPFLFYATYWHPYTASFTALRAGSAGISPLNFVTLALPAILAWNLFWGLSMYLFGNFLGTAENFVILIILYLIGWAIFSIIKAYHQPVST